METRFESKFERITESGCWIWTASMNKKGYGRYHETGGESGFTLAHRASWKMNKGPIPDGLLVCHRCDVPQCVNPDHLFLGTHKDNLYDAIKKKGRKFLATRKFGSHCPKGHKYPESLGIKTSGVRYCLACNRDRATEFRALKRSSDH
jgi:hypothetical protein